MPYYYEIPKRVQLNAQKGLDLRRVHKRGGTEVGVRMARRLAAGKPMTYQSVKKVSQYFPRHQYDRLDLDGKAGRQISNGYIAWLLWGGDAGWSWSEKVVEREEE